MYMLGLFMNSTRDLTVLNILLTSVCCDWRLLSVFDGIDRATDMRDIKLLSDVIISVMFADAICSMISSINFERLEFGVLESFRVLRSFMTKCSLRSSMLDSSSAKISRKGSDRHMFKELKVDDYFASTGRRDSFDLLLSKACSVRIRHIAVARCDVFSPDVLAI